MVIEARCVGCGKRFRLKGDPQAVDFLSLPCPECGGMLEMVSKEGETYSEMEFLLEKPLALVFWDHPADKASFMKALVKLGYEVRPIRKPALLSQWLRFNPPALLVFVCEEGKELDPYLRILNSLPMTERRKIFVVWVTSRAKTLDPRLAYLKGIELVINWEDLSRFPDLLKRGQKIWQDFYTPFLEVEEALSKEI